MPRREAKVAMLGAMYGATAGDGGRLMPALTRAAASTTAMARGNARVSAGISRPPSPAVAPYMAPSMATFASARVATAPLATMPS
jgi:hypothetical protein